METSWFKLPAYFFERWHFSFQYCTGCKKRWCFHKVILTFKTNHGSNLVVCILFIYILHAIYIHIFLYLYINHACRNKLSNFNRHGFGCFFFSCWANNRSVLIARHPEVCHQIMKKSLEDLPPGTDPWLRLLLTYHGGNTVCPSEENVTSDAWTIWRREIFECLPLDFGKNLSQCRAWMWASPPQKIFDKLHVDDFSGFSADSTQNLWLHGSTCARPSILIKK